MVSYESDSMVSYESDVMVSYESDGLGISLESINSVYTHHVMPIQHILSFSYSQVIELVKSKNYLWLLRNDNYI